MLCHAVSSLPMSRWYLIAPSEPLLTGNIVLVLTSGRTHRWATQMISTTDGKATSKHVSHAQH